MISINVLCLNLFVTSKCAQLSAYVQEAECSHAMLLVRHSVPSLTGGKGQVEDAIYILELHQLNVIYVWHVK